MLGDSPTSVVWRKI